MNLPPLAAYGRGGHPGAGQSAPQSELPAGSADGGGFIEPLVRRVVLAKVNTAGTSRTSAAVAARIYNPAARLVCSFSVTFEPRTPQDFSNYNSATWSVRVMRGAFEGREAKLHALFTGIALPEQYEVTSAARSLLIESTVTIPQTAAAAAIEGEWVLQVEWEPAISMCPGEAAALYSRCGATQTLRAAGPLAP